MTCVCGIEFSKFAVEHSGACPHFDGHLEPAVLDFIQNHTHTDDRGFRYFKDRNGTWHRLVDQGQFDYLNEMIDEERVYDAHQSEHVGRLA